MLLVQLSFAIIDHVIYGLSPRKLSLQTPPPNSSNKFGRPPEAIGENKIIKFGETKLRSPSPGRQPGFMRNGPERKTR